MIFKKERILVCDDQPMLRNLLGNAIREFSAKYEVVEAPNGAIAEQLLRKDEFWAVFMDVEMPVQDGFTTLEKIRAENLVGDSPVIMCTGCDQEEHLLRGWQLNADYYLTKPFDLDEVDTLLKELAQKRVQAMDAAAVESLEIPMPDVPVPSLSE
jgi:two-component system OmpR family response regulator